MGICLRSLVRASTVLAVLTATAATAQQRGGAVDIAMPGEPPTLDPMVSSVTSLYTITQHYFETLYSLDPNMVPVPLLAGALPEISEEGRSYTIRLRGDVRFHDGRAMTAVDVVASLRRWLQVAARGKDVAPYVESVEEVDPLTLRIRLRQAYSPLLDALSFNATPAVITPADNVAVPMRKFIGTGPYMLKEYKPDQYIQLVRFEGYASPPAPIAGCAGERRQYLDEIRFRPVPDVSTRLEGLLAGQFQYADQLPVESVSRLEASRDAKAVLINHGYQAIYVNMAEGPMARTKIRQAVLAALNMEDMLIAAFGAPRFYKVDGSLFPEGSAWHTQAGLKGLYNQADPARAAALLREAKYDGTPIRFLTSRQYDHLFNMSQVAAEYLRNAGFVVDLQVLDWASLSQRRGEARSWDLYVTFVGNAPDPSVVAGFSADFVNHWTLPAKEEALRVMYSGGDLRTRVAAFERVQSLVMTDVPFIKVGDFVNLAGRSSALEGVSAGVNSCFWNAWLAR